MSTEILGTDEISQSDNDKFVTHNTANRQIEGQITRVIDRDAGGPPGSPSNGDIYIVDVASGTWASASVNDIAHYFGGQWVFYTPKEGAQRFWVNDENIVIAWDGTAWVNMPLVSVFGGTLLTVGAVPFINATADGLALDAANFFWDDSNNRLGIGTNTPSYQLDLGDGVSNLATIGTNDAALRLRADGTRSIQFFTNSNEAVRINSSGDVGINLTNQVAKLQVAVAQASPTGVSNGIRVHENTNNYGLNLGGNSTYGYIQGLRGVNTTLGYNNLVLQPNSNNVGVGITPTEKLHVEGGILITKSAALGVLQIKDASDTSGAVAKFKGSSTKSSWLLGNQFNINGGFEITPSTAAGGDTFSTPALAILDNGDVGIGDSSPSETLDVNGTIAAQTGIKLGGGTDLLDTYEKGTWTPAIADASSAGNTATFTNNVASYTRIGREVTVRYDFSAIDTTGMTGGNFLFIRGLPFTINSAMSLSAQGALRVDNITFSGYLTTQGGSNTTYFRLLDCTSAAAASELLVSAVTSGSGRIAGTLTYYV